MVAIILVAALAGVVFDETAGVFWRPHRRRQIADRHELDALRMEVVARSDVKDSPPDSAEESVPALARNGNDGP